MAWKDNICRRLDKNQIYRIYVFFNTSTFVGIVFPIVSMDFNEMYQNYRKHSMKRWLLDFQCIIDQQWQKATCMESQMIYGCFTMTNKASLYLNKWINTKSQEIKQIWQLGLWFSCQKGVKQMMIWDTPHSRTNQLKTYLFCWPVDSSITVVFQ